MSMDLLVYEPEDLSLWNGATSLKCISGLPVDWVGESIENKKIFIKLLSN